jgi:transposase-like protein
VELHHAAAGSGSIGEILRREGIYSSTLTNWRQERDAAVDNAFSQKRGPEPKRNPLTAENEKLRRQNQRLQENLRRAEIIIDVQKKLPCCWVARCRRFRTAGTPDGRRGRTQRCGRYEAVLPGSFRFQIGSLPAPQAAAFLRRLWARGLRRAV